MRPGNRYDRGNTLGDLIRAKLVLLAACRRCKHQSLIYRLIIALDLRQTLEGSGAIVIGPAPDVASAMAMLQNRAFDAAVLDHLIVGGDSLPVADELCPPGCAVPVPYQPSGAVGAEVPRRARDR